MQAFIDSVFVFERWHYAFNGIMDVHIRRVSRMWSWSNIRQHRQNLKAYKTAYKTKLVSSGKVNQDTEQQVQVLERKEMPYHRIETI